MPIVLILLSSLTSSQADLNYSHRYAEDHLPALDQLFNLQTLRRLRESKTVEDEDFLNGVTPRATWVTPRATSIGYLLWTRNIRVHKSGVQQVRFDRLARHGWDPASGGDREGWGGCVVSVLTHRWERYPPADCWERYPPADCWKRHPRRWDVWRTYLHRVRDQSCHACAQIRTRTSRLLEYIIRSERGKKETKKERDGKNLELVRPAALSVDNHRQTDLGTRRRGRSL